jgi:hypothetical protein
MTIERTENEVIIRLPAYIDTDGLKNMIELLWTKETTPTNEIKQSQIDELVKEVKNGWWLKNRDKFIK